jgi:Concanavalin A-like lectin/glucanases superfamily
VGKGRVVSLLVGVAIAAALIGASAASAATLVGDYQLQGTRASSGAGPTLTDVGDTNSFQTDTVMGASRQVLAFPQHSGVRISPAGLGTSPYSVVTTFRLASVSEENYFRILDSTNGTDDAGFYAYQGGTDYYYTQPHAPVEEFNPAAVLASDVYATAVLTVSPPSESKFYVNGSLQLASTEGLVPVSDTLRLFKDNDNPTTDEDSAGAVSCIRVYSGALTDQEVGGIGASPTCGTVASPAPTPVTPHKKKCKKHKKKHRSAESAKKKKCKKKRKKR